VQEDGEYELQDDNGANGSEAHEGDFDQDRTPREMEESGDFVDPDGEGDTDMQDAGEDEEVYTH
jgi:hypothetical protein